MNVIATIKISILFYSNRQLRNIDLFLFSLDVFFTLAIRKYNHYYKKRVCNIAPISSAKHFHEKCVIGDDQILLSNSDTPIITALFSQLILQKRHLLNWFHASGVVIVVQFVKLAVFFKTNIDFLLKATQIREQTLIIKQIVIKDDCQEHQVFASCS